MKQKGATKKYYVCRSTVSIFKKQKYSRKKHQNVKWIRNLEAVLPTIFGGFQPGDILNADDSALFYKETATGARVFEDKKRVGQKAG